MKKNKFIISGIILVILILGSVIWIAYSRNQNYETSDAKQYAEMKSKLKGKVFSELGIFPEEIKNNEKSIKYYVECERKTLDFSVQIYLECEYEEKEFQEEQKRLAKMETMDEEYQLRHSIVKDTENFYYPSYIMIFQDNYTYEYALVDEKNKRIIYIYLQHVNYEDLNVDDIYLDKKYIEYMENGESEIGYNQYGFSSSEYDMSFKRTQIEK